MPNPYKEPSLCAPDTRFGVALAPWVVCVSSLVANLAIAVFADTREWLVHFDPTIVYCVAFPLYVLALPALAWIAIRKLPQKTPLILASIAEAFWILMALSSWLCRDTFLAFSWPWQRPGFTLTARNDKNLSEMLWQQLDVATPENPLVRELPGLLATLLCLIFVLLLTRSGTVQRLRQSTSISILSILLFFPVVILLKQSFGIKYLVAFPELFLQL